ncbi:MAG: membrane protein insertase YidC [Alphaproteobacteria bacterium]|jgi:YidC/Oxa1 family membrane protein insertase|uniref:Membrane protein insertase YidC n=2 Tax=root TaxID=1 RepID=E0XWL0_9PROT|nr:preprotein translocase subunit yidc [uncultured SAR11 cluster bacterium HF4000_37C10]MBL4626200.1 membrane protein insertase YidC [Pelagibacteraceae bacterium]RUA13541.1 MAG: membrane protein insertase YidC [Alphaproteobacteria bacterium]|tara:strand:- start:179 stop:1861 length:1683 start_codon:yes stop_codon:yes gene_type:complete
MDSKNVLMAIVLSTLVLVFWATFFEPPPVERQIAEDQVTKSEELSSPSIEKVELSKKIARDDTIDSVARVKIENNNIKGSISLQGAIIDDIIFKNYKESLESDQKVIFLNPKSSDEGYYIETGWASNSNEKLKLPLDNTIWKVKGNKVLTPNKPIVLEWDNNEGLIFTKKIELDDKYLFKISQGIKNTSNKSYEFFPYAQITRNYKPDVIPIYILHEGFIGMFDDELKEEDYEDVEDEKFIINSSKGWLGITDKYWLTAIVPEKGKKFKSEFLSIDGKYKANFIIKEATVLSSNASITNEINAFVMAKEVAVIDDYAEKLGIEKFDLTIDWGWFYFITKPLFFVIEYFFKLTGNFGVAIIILTALVRIVFFPLANYSFRSMAKMKILQPEMIRLKELHKDDKTKLQQEMMALYKREKVNPVSGCLPVLIQIPFFFAVYKMLYVTIEMRQQPFFGWIQDLSARDPTSIFNLFGLIPWDPPTFLMIGVWPILMGLTMFLQQKLNPTPPDPMQAKIFMFLPIFLTIILAPFPSGLVVYWTVSNVLTMAQQWVIIRGTKVKTVR